MNIEREIQQIKKRLTDIESSLPKAVSQGASPLKGDSTNAASLFKVLSFDVKRSQGLNRAEYAYKLVVKNTSPSSLRFLGAIIFLDADDFEITQGSVMPFTVAAGNTVTRTGMISIYDPNHASRIANVTAELYPA